jgi:hypothetical protein
MESEEGSSSGLGRLDVVGTVESDGRVYKIVEFQAGDGSEISGHHHHLATAEDGTLIHVRTIDGGGTRTIPLRFHSHHGPEEAATLLRLQDFTHHVEEDPGTEEMMTGGGEEVEEVTEMDHEVKILSHVGGEEGEEEEHEHGEEEEEQTQYLELFTAEEHEGVVGEDGEGGSVIHLRIDPENQAQLESLISGSTINVTEGLSYEEAEAQETQPLDHDHEAHHDDGEGGGEGGEEMEDGAGLVFSTPIIKEPPTSTAAALDLGCEWSLTLPFGFQGQGLNDQCQKLILNVWHYFKHLKKYPELIDEKNAQGLAGDALNVGTKTIGRIGKSFRTGKLQNIMEHKLIQDKKRKRPSSDPNKVSPCLIV